MYQNLWNIVLNHLKFKFIKEVSVTFQTLPELQKEVEELRKTVKELEIENAKK